MNPLQNRVSLVECAGGGELPSLRIAFATVADMHAAADFVRSLPAHREKAMESMVSEVLASTSPSAGEDRGS